ncbi:RagB/SusD family nutrient uptake outer membrane protein [Pinibacter soli]|uniref:RagB/SusD family nutrient uptake outer membrane protein n=1 Tax=Pinibacter soli TaxID=3044211 RepID=A0ABT6RD35_9BACT|nr:RagB/SusD family nutrient uptake outer membrane protein [Pinibacter soli]MDI3320455.1 RagB/SusD family nutrient uptake outer membrane protein [Pinibacter soli]
MINRLYNIFATAVLLVIVAAGCTKKLDLTPTNDVTADEVYKTPLGYKQALAKVYGAFALTGNTGGTGTPDISPEIISDEGNSDFLRLYWNLQELTTDEAAWSWPNDAGIQGLKEMSWSSDNPIVKGVYYRSMFQIAIANDFIRQSTPDKVSGRGITGNDAADIKKYHAEARFIRAYQYWVLMDLYANPPFADENTTIAVTVPDQIKRADLFKYIESELKAIEPDMAAPKANEYPRADQGAVWALLSRLYLNAKVYTGTERFTDAITYCNKIIAAGYTLNPKYRNLTVADNNLNTDENIFMIAYDAKYTQNWGGTTYLAHGPVGVPAATSGTSGSWTGLRHTQQFVALFPDPSGNTDVRAQFYTPGQILEMKELYKQTDGYSSSKYRNLTHDGKPAPNADPNGNWADIDFPIFRLGEIYLTYAESVLRNGTGGNATQALTYINALRKRAWDNKTGGEIAAAQLTLNFILDERGRELYYEAQRRTDLVRFDKFTTDTYLWAWKGGSAAGKSVNTKYNVFPIPSIDLTSNPHLVQNTGY